MVSHFRRAKRSVLHRSATLSCPGPIVPRRTLLTQDGEPTIPSDSWLFPLFQNLDLLSDGRHAVVYFLGLRFEIGRDCSQLPGVVFQSIAIMFERFDNRL